MPSNPQAFIDLDSKFKKIEGDSWKISALLHLGAVVLYFGALWMPEFPRNTTVEMEVIEAPRVSTAAKAIEIEKPRATIPEPTRKAVFGVNPKSNATDENSDVAVKAGNTVAKSIDQEKLDPNDDQNLPIPADEFLVSSMPKLKSEIRIPYPPEARQQNIQGAVVMDLLIDQNGKVRKATLLEGPGYGLNEAALNAIKSFEFEPAKIEQKPVAVKIRYAYRFVLEK
jgi:periplasmic protein TonB